MSFDSVARTLLGIEKIGLPNVGILLDFGHALFGGESPPDSAQLAIDYGRLFGMDVNDNLRCWDDDLVAGSLHPIELFEFFYTLRKNKWEGVWQLDQFPFREDSVAAANTCHRLPQAVATRPRRAGRRALAGSAGPPRRNGGVAAGAVGALLRRGDVPRGGDTETPPGEIDAIVRASPAARSRMQSNRQTGRAREPTHGSRPHWGSAFR